MSTKAKWTAIRLTVEAVGVLLIAVFLVARYEGQITAINWRLVSLVCVGAAAVFGIYRWQMREDNAYDVMDMLTKNGRADLYAHLTIASFVLAVWVVIQQALAKQPVTELLLGVLGIFVVGKAAGGFSDALQNRPVVPSHDVNILPDAQIQAAPAEAPPPAEQAAPKQTTRSKK